MIDFHSHIFPDKIADKTIQHLAGICGTPPFLNGTKEQLLASIEEAGIERSVLLPVLTSPNQFESVHRFTAQFLEGRLLSFGGIHPDDENYKERLRWLKQEGYKGIKLHSDYQNTYFDDIKTKRIISCASELDMIIVIHAGQDPYSPNNIHCTPKMIAEVIEETVPTKLVLAHMGGHLMYDDVENYLVGRDVYFDTAYVLDKMKQETILRLIRKHGADKILFGTDSPWAGQKDFVNCFNKLPLSVEEYHMISHQNAEKLLR